jgi:hypothetical protein
MPQCCGDVRNHQYEQEPRHIAVPFLQIVAEIAIAPD